MRLFVSLDLPKEVIDYLTPVKEELLSLPVSLTPNEQIHATLCFIGEAEPSKVAEIIEKLKVVECLVFEVRAKGIGTFPTPSRPRIVWVGLFAPQLLPLSKAVHSALNLTPDKPFKGHATLARVRQQVDLTNLVARFSTTDFGSFEAKSFKLKQSALTSRGSVFTTLQEFHLK